MLYDKNLNEKTFKMRDNGDFLRKEVNKSALRIQAVKSGIYVSDAIAKIENDVPYPEIIAAQRFPIVKSRPVSKNEMRVDP